MRICRTYTQCTQYVIHVYIYIYTHVHHMYYKCSIDTCIVCGPRMPHIFSLTPGTCTCLNLRPCLNLAAQSWWRTPPCP